MTDTMPDFKFFDRQPIVFADYFGKSITEMPIELFNFSMESQVSEVSSGAQALRVGYYKIIETPALRTNLQIDTYACNVLYIKDDYEKPVKYYCNVGPLFNFEALYFNNQDSIQRIWDKFVRYGSYRNKEDFFERGLEGNILQVIKDETVVSAKFNNTVRKITWKFV